LLIPDLLVIGIGGNDISFGEVVQKLVLRNKCDENCIEKIVNPKLGTLDEGLSTMKANIDSRLKPKRVLMLDYPDLTKNEDGIGCNEGNKGLQTSDDRQKIGPIKWIFGVNSNEFQEAVDLVIQPLNLAEAEFIKSHPGTWDRPLWMADAAKRHGICAKESWFTGFTASQRMQGYLPKRPFPSGDAHPNVIYHAEQADRIIGWLNEKWPKLPNPNFLASSSAH
jgi:hypothetical protein